MARDGHHLFPQEFRDKFKAAGIDTDKFVIQLPEAIHNFIHSNVGGNWNRVWAQFFESYEKRGELPSAAQIGFQLLKMLVSDFRQMLPYGTKDVWTGLLELVKPTVGPILRRLPDLDSILKPIEQLNPFGRLQPAW